jgi:hypothetical protein
MPWRRIGGVDVYIHSFFDLGTRWRWVVIFTPRPLYPQGRAPGTHWIGGWVSPRAVLDAVVKRKIPSPRRESNPRTAIVQPIAQLSRLFHCEVKNILNSGYASSHSLQNIFSYCVACLIIVLALYGYKTTEGPNRDENTRKQEIA